MVQPPHWLPPRDHRRGPCSSLQDDHSGHGPAGLGESLINDALQGHRLPLSIGQIRAEQGLRARHLEAIAQGAGSEPCEDRNVDRANPDAIAAPT